MPEAPAANFSVERERWSDAATRIVLDGISWATYEQLLLETGAQRNAQLAYNDGQLEIMVPLIKF